MVGPLGQLYAGIASLNNSPALKLTPEQNEKLMGMVEQVASKQAAFSNFTAAVEKTVTAEQLQYMRSTVNVPLPVIPGAQDVNPASDPSWGSALTTVAKVAGVKVASVKAAPVIKAQQAVPLSSSMIPPPVVAAECARGLVRLSLADSNPLYQGRSVVTTPSLEDRGRCGTEMSRLRKEMLAALTDAQRSSIIRTCRLQDRTRSPLPHPVKDPGQGPAALHRCLGRRPCQVRAATHGDERPARTPVFVVGWKEGHAPQRPQTPGQAVAKAGVR